MLISMGIEFEPNKSPSQCDSGPARGKRSTKRIQNQIIGIAGIGYELFNE